MKSFSFDFRLYDRSCRLSTSFQYSLYEIKKYANNTITFTQILAKQSSESITTISKTNEKVKAVNKEIKIYTESNRKEAGSLEMQELYDKVKRMILNIGDDISIKATKFYIAFIRKTNFCDINIQKNQIKIWLNVKKGKLEDSKKIARNVADIGHWGNGDYEIALNSDADIEYVVSLIRQSYNLNE